ncbi:MAG: RNA ligase [Pseudanabaena sp.]|nr:T4 RnlA family RNA ligase [Pseudanabaena sp. M53BS1SP1A06MG]MCA6584465.1 T4 RnlA family RNA ligase [Pseudanabaena sp. M34BS1SP1A06MG]MCA6586262.1 T4 RnlA family RNA ligase [Pseudanabaena sp. M051S1SP1A06QC]MCA6588721.1 T4 RnlA family RNA ligase [Pseudanabaena sp. M109S1SP1A06QC]MCA6592297.1 T4 RnlA family RNA ligase [Pseudanabaena sp. M38BS1SP1A06MG]MCA6596176.1 T4 RnlA family RNA ligase [Pseudanabaena sp. M046S1SP1A06QC]MCA6599472.1 T4 RnlA family RNA ligase [Pseudanabaena sp. M57BS1SP1A0
MNATNLERIDQLILEGYITKRPHSSGELFIYNYTAKAQYDHLWTPETMQCRGLILDHHGVITARPLIKFFNLQEHQASLPAEPFEVYEKLDGSLGILYWYQDQPYIASRGSFNSDQAIKANQILYCLYADAISLLDRSLTYLFEIIYPANRIVVDYGDYEALVLLAVIETASGREYAIEDFQHLGFPIAKKYDGLKDLESITKLNEQNQEGFVIRFESGLRLKFKFADYVKLHRVLTQVTSKVIWEMLRDQIPFEDILEHVPDEFYDWVKETKAMLLGQYQQIEDQAKEDFERIVSIVDRHDRKETAKHFLACQNHTILFSMLDGKDYSDYIWRTIKPAHEKPFTDDDN